MNFGVPKQNQYQKLLSSNLFKQMEIFSNHFLVVNQQILRPYAKKWVADPLHQWSRQWEYPFVFYWISKLLSKSSNKCFKTLDAGSGVTFFPYYLKYKFNNRIKLTCLDKDKMCDSMITRINQKSQSKVYFTSGDLTRLPFPNYSLNLIYCLSVLEHIKDWQLVIKEFSRVLKSNGFLIVTFDVSLNNTGGVTLTEAAKILTYMNEIFHPLITLPKISANLKKIDSLLINTKYFQKRNPQLLPWRIPVLTIIKQLIKGDFVFDLPNLTIYCAVFNKC